MRIIHFLIVIIFARVILVENSAMEVIGSWKIYEVCLAKVQPLLI